MKLWDNESVYLDALKIKVGHCDLHFMVSNFVSYFEDYLMYKHDTWDNVSV